MWYDPIGSSGVFAGRRRRLIILSVEGRPRELHSVELFGFDARVTGNLTITGAINGRASSTTVGDRLGRNSRDMGMKVPGVGGRSSPEDRLIVIIRYSNIELNIPLGIRFTVV
jgi:hypothetical protein